MDIQVKLLFDIQIYQGENLKTISNPSVEINNYDNTFLGNAVVEFNEYNVVDLSVESNIEAAYVKIETYNSEEMVVVKNGQSHIRITCGGTGDNMLVPGDYEFKVETPDNEYSGLFKVNTIGISWEGLTKIRTYLENIVNGLAYNLYAKRIGELEGTSNRSMTSLYEYLENNYDNFSHIMESIIANPLSDINKIYKKVHYSKQEDVKSQRWMCQKGTFVNSNIFIPNIFYGRHTKLTYINVENKFISKILFFIRRTIKDIRYIYEKKYNYIYQDCKNKLQEYEEVTISYLAKKDNPYLASNFKNELRLKKYNTSEYIKRLKAKIQYLDNIISRTGFMIRKLDYYLYDTWLKDVIHFEMISSPTLRLLKNGKYFFIYNFYNNMFKLKNIDNKKSFSCKKIFSYKKTSILFEYYSLVQVIKALEEIGFEWKSGWLADYKDSMNSDIYNGEILSGTVLEFKRDDFIIKVWYDKEVSKDPRGKNEFVAINARHRRPDIILAIYRVKDNKFIKSIIIEVKCRRTSYIYSTNGETSVVEQIKDYYNFSYYNCLNDNTIRGAVDRVLLVYPKQDKDIKCEIMGYKFSFIPIDPIDADKVPLGYKEIKGEIEDFINKYVSDSLYI